MKSSGKGVWGGRSLCADCRPALPDNLTDHKNRWSVPLILCALALSGCRQDMHVQPRYEPLGATDFFGDRRSARPPVEGTVARGQARADTALYYGRSGDQPVSTIPVKITRGLLERGQQRFNIFCTPCHGGLGDGEGMVVQRGFRRPPSYHIDRLRQAPPGHFFDVMTNGFGAMPAYGYRVPAEDRWAIIAYIRALQLSRNATQADVPPDRIPQLQGGGQ